MGSSDFRINFVRFLDFPKFGFSGIRMMGWSEFRIFRYLDGEMLRFSEDPVFECSGFRKENGPVLGMSCFRKR